MIRWGGLRSNSQGSNQEIGVKVKERKVITMGITTERANMFEMETTTMTTTSTGVIIVTEMIEVGLMFHLKIGKFLKGWWR